MERLPQHLIDILPVGAWVTDAHGRIVRNNRAAERIWSGASPPAAADADRFRAWWQHTRQQFVSQECGMPAALATAEPCAGRAVAIECFDGSTKTILYSADLLHDSRGRVTGSIGISEDITAITTNEEQWHRREQLLHTMIDLLPVGVWATDKRGRVTLINPAASRIWSGHNWDGEIDPTSFKGWWADTGKPVAVEEWAIVRALREGVTSRGGLVHIETLDGHHRTIINWAAPLRNDRDRITGAVAVAEDITALYRVQEQLRAAVSDREQILAIVAHDLRNPLGSIMIGASTAGAMAARLPGADKLHKRLDVVLDLARQMSGMVDDLLSIAVSTGGGKPMLDIEPVCPGTLVEQACERARPLFAEAGVELRCEVASDMPTIHADVHRIQRVLANLLDNALKYTDPPCYVTLSAQGQGPVVFSVAAPAWAYRSAGASSRHMAAASGPSRHAASACACRSRSRARR
jgi:PAS domain S-box-containing protein